MAKTIVVSTNKSTRVPFLRGILTRSLQHAGLSFDEAYNLAKSIRSELADTPEINTNDLRATVVRRLEHSGNTKAADTYQTKVRVPAPILVRDGEGNLIPFSRGRLQQRLESCGLWSDESLEITRMIYDHLLNQEAMEITSHNLAGLTYDSVKSEVGPDQAHRYLVWTQFKRSGRPLLLLIGGTAGSGKSTIATEIASHLGIVRAQSTDMLREVMRMMIPERLLPVLHASSFNAWQKLDQQPDENANHAALLRIGYRRQAELVAVACDAVIQRALREQVSMVLEGVHVRPSLLDAMPENNGAVVVPVILAVLKPDLLRQRIKGRGAQVLVRRAERYLRHFDAIWQLQSVLLAEADRAGIAIITNEEKEMTVREVMITISDYLAREFSGSPKEVFTELAIRSPKRNQSPDPDHRPMVFSKLTQALSWRKRFRRQNR